MKLPAPVYSDGLRKNTQMRFNGYEAMGTEGAICDMKNMTSDYWPELAVRQKRKLVRNVSDPGGMAAWEDMIWAEGTDLHYGSTVVSGILQSGVMHCFAVLGDYITIWPEKKWYDIVAGTSGDIEASMTLTYAVFRSFAAESGISDTANCIQLPWLTGTTIPFRAGDAVTISGCSTVTGNNGRSMILREVHEQEDTRVYTPGTLITSDDGIALDRRPGWTSDGIYARNKTLGFTTTYYGEMGNYSITLPANISSGYFIKLNEDETADIMNMDGVKTATVEVGSELMTDHEITIDLNHEALCRETNVTISRVVPDMDYVFSHENRLFGFKGDTIYVSKLGDIFNWNVFDGTASDSWATETGTAGSFTGGIAFGGYPRFFKENYIFTLYGDYPQEYQLQSQELLGVAKGSLESLTPVNGWLYYLSPLGPVAYGGGVPAPIAEAFGLARYKNGVGGTDGVKWYLSMEDEDGAWHLFVYDTVKRIWIREDDLRVQSFAKYTGDIWALTQDGRLLMLGRPLNVPEGSIDAEDELKWMAEFGDITGQSPDRKRVTKLQIRLEMDEGALAIVSMLYDSAPAWTEVAKVTAKRKQTMVLPIIPRRLDHFRLRIEGVGGCRISSIARQTAPASAR